MDRWKAKKRRVEERKRKSLKKADTGARNFRKVEKHRVFTNDLWLGQKNGKGCQMRSLDLVPISFRSRSASRSDSFFSYIFHAVMNEPCTVWFAVVGVRVGMNFLCVLHSVRMVLSMFGDVSGCAEWAVHSVICCWWHESRIGFSLCFTTLCVWFC